MSEENFFRAIVACRNGLASIVEQLNDILKEHAPVEARWEKVYPIKSDSQILAEFLVNPDGARLQPKQPLPTDCGPFGWLVSTLDRYREKHPNFKFQVKERDKQLSAIDFPCQIEDPKRFVGWFQWALKRMAEEAGKRAISNTGWERRNQALRSIKEAGRRLTGEPRDVGEEAPQQ